MEQTKTLMGCTKQVDCHRCRLFKECNKRLNRFGNKDCFDIVKLEVAYEGQWKHPRTSELMVSRAGITPSGKYEPPISRTGSPKEAHNRRQNQQLVSGKITVSDNHELKAVGYLKNKPTAQWQGVWTITKRKRTIGGHSWFDSNPNRK